MPQCLFTASKRLIIFDHLTHKIRAVALAHLTGREDLKEAYATACEEVDEIVSELKTPFFHPSGGDEFSVSGLKPNVKREEFQEAVQRAKDYIVAGDVIQVVLSPEIFWRGFR
jgi:anthranilate synthase component 1